MKGHCTHTVKTDTFSMCKRFQKGIAFELLIKKTCTNETLTKYSRVHPSSSSDLSPQWSLPSQTWSSLTQSEDRLHLNSDSLQLDEAEENRENSRRTSRDA